MNLTKLFETQRILDARIMEKHPELVGQNNLDWKVLALQVELGECANEWRGFKKWSNDQEARTKVYVLKEKYKHCHITQTGAYEYQLRDEFGKVVEEDVTDHHHDIKNPLLEEYVDCLHFILSIGLEIGASEENFTVPAIARESITKQFLVVIDSITTLYHLLDYNMKSPFDTYRVLFMQFVNLGGMLGFTWEQIEQAYYDKNAINHTRQDTGY